MNTEIQTFNSDDATLHVLTDETGDPWFVAKDVCDILGLGTEHLRRNLEEDEVTKATNLPNWQVGPNGGRTPLIISEPGLYKLIMRSRYPTARHCTTGHLVMVMSQKHGTKTDGTKFALPPTVRITRKGLALLHKRLGETNLANALETTTH